MIQFTTKTKNERFDPIKLHLARKLSTNFGVQSIGRQISAKGILVAIPPSGETNGNEVWIAGGKRLPVGQWSAQAVTQNVLHVIKFQVADESIYVTGCTDLIIN
ncbi:hypothetical protein [Aeromonas sp. AE23HZ002T15]